MINIVFFAAIALFSVAGYSAYKDNDATPLLKEHYLLLTDLLTEGNQKANAAVKMFFDDRSGYFKKHEDELYERGIESPVDIPEVIVLVDTLIKHEKLVYQDHKTRPDLTLGLLNKLSAVNFENSECYKDLMAHFKNTKYGIGAFLDLNLNGPSIFECFKSQGYHLLSIDEDSDSYALILVKDNDFEKLKKLSYAAGVKLHYVNK